VTDGIHYKKTLVPIIHKGSLLLRCGTTWRNSIRENQFKRKWACACVRDSKYYITVL